MTDWLLGLMAAGIYLFCLRLSVRAYECGWDAALSYARRARLKEQLEEEKENE